MYSKRFINRISTKRTHGEAASMKNKGPRFQFEVQLPSEESRAGFSLVIEEAKRLMTPPGRKKVDNYHLIMSLVDCAKKHTDLTSQSHEPPQRQLSWLESSGK